MEGVKDRVAVVTGAGQGNGRAIALGLARQGAHVALCDINGQNALDVAAEIEALGVRAYAAAVDVSDKVACAGFADACRERLGEVEILVNNAGIIRRQPIAEADFDDGWDALFRVNVDGTRNMLKALLPQLRARRGRVVNLGSIMSVTAGAGISAYAATKGAILQFTKAMANELAADGIRVNAIAPGVIATPMTEATRANSAAIAKFMGHTPLGRVGEPDELVGPVLFLVSDMSSYVTGVLLPVDGGYLTA
ncbi:NAD(P)-dependent dehydrogenase (short-subunit alcohol dehydrogenase family) [Amorphus suaedae]